MEGSSSSAPLGNGNPTPPASPVANIPRPGSSKAPSIPKRKSSLNRPTPPRIELPPTPSPSSSAESSHNAPSTPSRIQGSSRFYSERNPVPKVEHFPWESLYRGPAGIPRVPGAARQSRAGGSSNTSRARPIVNAGTPPVSPTSDNTVDGIPKMWMDKNTARPDFGDPRRQVQEERHEEDRNAGTKETSRREAVERKHAKVVTDPITREEVAIVDAKYLPPHPIPATTPTISPPASWTLYSTELRNITIKFIAGILLAFLILTGLFRFHMSVPLFVSFGAILAWYRQVDALWLDVVHHDPVLYSHPRRNRNSISSVVNRGRGSERGGGTGPESVIWLNNTIAKLWPQINADLFKPVTDMLEDVMQASIPSIVQQIRIRDIGQGVEPIRILSMRWLDHDDGEVEEINTPSPDKSGEDLLKSANNEDDQESIGEWASMEITFAFRGVGQGVAGGDKASNPFLMVNMSLGLKGVLGAPELPIWVELRGLQGTCRLKVQLIPDPPFIKLASFSLMGMPRIEISAVPLNKRFLNVMSLPVISDFVYSSIKLTAREFCAPKSFTMDLSKMLVGDDTKKELNAIGVLVVHIDRAKGVRAADKLTGKSDCYVTLSYAKFGKTLWSSRIIFCDLNPVWDETAILLVNADEIKAGERLAVEIWDSDRFTVDDLLGRIEVDVIDLVKRRGKVRKRTDSLMGYKKGQYMPGTLAWSVCFYGKASLDGQEANEVGREVQSTAEMDRTAFTAATPAPPAPSDPNTLVTKVPPSPAFPSGILSIQVHNIVGLSVPPPSSTRASNQRIGVSTTTEEEEEGDTLPSAYCSIMLSYEKIYKTRIKPMSSKPFFNAGTERFVRDWRYSSVLVVVRDSRMREEDPILGVVELKLKDVFRHESVISRYYPIQGGIGYGKVRISLLFRSIDTVLPRMLLGADIGSIEIVSPWIDGSNITDEEVKRAGSITFETPLIKKKALREASAGVGWSPVHNTHGSTGFRLGVRHRHSSPCVLYFKRDLKLRRDKVIAAAKFWLKDIPDDEAVTLRLDVFKPEDMDRFMQNACVDEINVGKNVGFIELRVRFHRGLGKSHRIAARQDRDFGDVIRAVQAVGEELRGEERTSADLETDVSGESDLEDDEAVGEGGMGGLKEILSRSGSKHKRRINSTPTPGGLLPISALPEITPAEGEEGDGHSSSSGNESDDEEGIATGGLARRRSDPMHSARHRQRTMTNSEMRKELNRRERGVMQWKGARTLAWVGRGVKDAGRGMKGKLSMGLGEGRGKRVGERGRNVGWGTEV